jgi:hypothetical protein
VGEVATISHDAPALISESKILQTLDAASKKLAQCRTPPDFIDHFNKIEALRTLADKAKMPRHVLNRVGEHLVRTVRLGGKASLDIDHLEGRPKKADHSDQLSPPTAKELGFSGTSHRRRLRDRPMAQRRLRHPASRTAQ